VQFKKYFPAMQIYMKIQWAYESIWLNESVREAAILCGPPQHPHRNFLLLLPRLVGVEFRDRGYHWLPDDENSCDDLAAKLSK